MKPVIDPRGGDVEDDASSTKSRSLLSLAGSLLAEISLPKLILSWIMLFVIPGLLLGLAPLVASAWVSLVSRKITSPLLGIWPALLLVTLVAIGLFGVRALFRMAERNFWSLNSLVVEPIYVACREALRQLVEKLLQSRLDKSQLATLRAGTAGRRPASLFLLLRWRSWRLCWPRSRWLGNLSELGSPRDLVVVALANSVVLVAAYLAIAALVWAFADATMPQLRDFGEFPPCQDADRTWRIVHLSDIHVVGERYGFRIESGRAGPRGNERLNRLLALLDSIHASKPLDIILITGDMTDAEPAPAESGRNSLDALDGLSAACRAGSYFARKSRPQHRRPCQSGSPRSPDKPEQEAAPASVFVGG